VETISQLWDTEPFLNEDFTVENLRSQHRDEAFDIIHLATHAGLDPIADDGNFIRFFKRSVLSDEFDELGLDRSVELLILSACQTAQRDDYDDVLGFAGFAINASVKTVLASLWQVNDASTLDLMQTLHARLLENAPIKAEALRQAQLALLQGNKPGEPGDFPPSRSNTSDFSTNGDGGDRDKVDREELNLESQNTAFRHPYYWAGFTMVGSPW
jgi:CHAT domain-containing protein